MDVIGNDDVKGTGETSRKYAEKLANVFTEYSNINNFDIKCEVLCKKEVVLEK